MKATATIVLDPRRQKTDGSFPLKLKITFLRKRKYYNIDINLSNEDWKKITTGNPRKDLLKTKLLIHGMEIEATKAINELGVFSFERFEKAYFKRKSKFDVYSCFDDKISSLSSEGKISTSNMYKNALSSLKTFRSKLIFIDITPEFLKMYESHMLKNNKGYSTISMYQRCLRSIWNIAIDEGNAPKEHYPFGRRKYIVPAGRNVKKALTILEIEKLYNYQPEPFSYEDRAKDFWFLSYYCNGANIKDILKLSPENIYNDTLTFTRAKTESRNREKKRITVILNNEAMLIINKWRSKNSLLKARLFPFLDANLSPEKELLIKNQFIKNINAGINKIATKIGIDKHITTYSARHSFSTVLKRSGAPIEYISESLGHSDLRTTENYLDSFEDETKRKYMSALTQFKSA